MADHTSEPVAAQHSVPPPSDETGVPPEIRSQAAQAHEDVYPAVKDQRWADAAAAGRRVLKLLQPYPNADRDFAFLAEKAWAYYALGMEAKSDGRLSEAASDLEKVGGLLPAVPQCGILPFEALNQLALVRADMDDLSRSAVAYRGLLTAIQKHSLSANVDIIWLGLGRVLERLSGPENRAAAMHAYSMAIRTRPPADTPDDRTHVAEACVGIVRCSFADRPGEARPFWAYWLGGYRSIPFAGLVVTILALFGFALYHMALGEMAYAWSLISTSMLPLLVILLPGLRRASLLGLSVEMQPQEAAMRFSLDLKAPSGEKLQA